MASVTGYTAARMKLIEDASIVDGNVVGDNLILKRFDETTINAGSVRGPIGLTGPTGDVSLAQLNAAVPAGVILMWAFSTVPTGYLLCDGSAIANASTLYPNLWAASPAGWKSGTTLTVPDLRGRFPVGQNTADTSFDVLTETGGSKNSVAVAHVHTTAEHTHTTPNHNHVIPDHAHTTPDHTHSFTGNTGSNSDGFDHVTRQPAFTDGGFATGINTIPWNAFNPVVLQMNSGTVATKAGMAVSYTGPHTHAISGSTGGASAGNTTTGQIGGTLTDNAATGNTTNSQTGGLTTASQSPTSDGVNANLPPYFVVRFIIKG